jgi:hypothetical protein
MGSLVVKIVFIENAVYANLSDEGRKLEVNNLHLRLPYTNVRSLVLPYYKFIQFSIYFSAICSFFL